ncbi:MAG: hypothetical protein ACYCTW_01645 [Sulfuricella sp.]
MTQRLELGYYAKGGVILSPEQGTNLDRRILKETFRQARKLQARLR